MPRPIDKEEFWETRLEEALIKENLPSAVYRTNTEDWETINRVHKATLSHYISPNQIVLDAGCGYGRASEFIPGIYIGVDFCGMFINLAKNLYPERIFLQGDLTRLVNFEDKVVDWSVCISIREMFIRELGEEHWNKALSELKRVSRIGIIILEYGDNTGNIDKEIILSS